MGRRRFVATLALIAALAGAVAAPASAFYQRYVTNGYFGPGSSATSAWNRLTFNSTSFVGGSFTMGTRYQRTDGTTTSWLWSSTGSIYDSRTIAYGRAFCAAAPTNPGSMFIDFCDTGNG
jgi:hypothetical protein